MDSDKKIKYQKEKIRKKEEKNKKKLVAFKKKYGKDLDKITLEKQVLEIQAHNARLQDTKKSIIKHRAVICILIGVLLLFIMMIGTAFIQIGVEDGRLKAILSALINGISCVISMVIGIGVSTLALDFFAYVQYTRERIKEVMIEKDYIETLSDDEKEKMIKTLEESLYFDSENKIENSLYSDIKHKVIPLLTKDFIEEYKIHIDCYVNEEQGYIRKKIYKRMVIESLKENNEFKIPFNAYLTKIGQDSDNKDREDLNAYGVDSCSLNGEDMTKTVRESVESRETLPNENQTIENIKYTIEQCFKLRKGKNVIELRTQTVVPIYDNTYSHVNSVPCHNYDVTFNMISPDYMVLGFGFALEEEKGERVVKPIRYENSFNISFSEWALPGEGCVFVINKKKPDN